jgi:hypothetical protein
MISVNSDEAGLYYRAIPGSLFDFFKNAFAVAEEKIKLAGCMSWLMQCPAEHAS